MPKKSLILNFGNLRGEKKKTINDNKRDTELKRLDEFRFRWKRMPGRTVLLFLYSSEF